MPLLKTKNAKVKINGKVNISTYDKDALNFVATSGATDIDSINLFVRGIKDLGLWNSMVCWPLRSSQNAGTGSTAYSLGGLGTYNGTLINGPTWGANGMTFVRTSTQHISTALQFSGTQNCSFFVSNSTNDDGGGSTGIITVMGTRNAGSITTTVMVGQVDNGGNSVRATFVIAPDNQIARPANPYTAAYIFEPTTPAQRVGVNGGAYNSATPSPAPLGGTQPPLYLGHTGPGLGDRGFNGTLHFCCAFASTSLTEGQFSTIHNLYKQTLGQGLGLP